MCYNIIRKRKEMKNNPYFVYSVIEIFLAFYSMSILGSLKGSLGSETEIKYLKRIIYTFLIVLITDIVWALMEGNIISIGYYLNASINCLSISSVLYGCYCWLKFLDYKIIRIDNKLKDYISILPLLVGLFMNIISIFTGWVFTIDLNGHYAYGPLIYIQAICCYSYLVIATILSIIGIIKSKSIEEKKERVLYVCYILPSIIASIFEDIFINIPILYLSMFLVIQALLLTIQNRLVYTDSLTGLNNRKKLNEYLTLQIKKLSNKNELWIFMLDINKFKSINDTYGHIKGDNALKIVSNKIMDYCSNTSSFAARYGGDEFCIILNNPKKIWYNIK